MKTAIWLARLVIAGVFLYAGVLKLGASERFAITVAKFAIVPDRWIGALAIGLPATETLIGILLLVPRTARLGAFAAAGLLTIFLAALAGLRATRWPAAFAPRVAALEIALLNQLGDATYYAGDVPGALAPYAQADMVADREIALRGETPTLAIVKTFADYNLSGTLGELPQRGAEALKRARAGSARMETLLASGPDASAEKLLLMTYGQEGVVLETMGKLAEARAVAAKGNAIRARRLARQPAHFQAIRDMAIGLLQSGRLEDLAGQTDAACATATRVIALFDRLKSMKALSEFDATNEMPKAVALRAKSCR